MEEQLKRKISEKFSKPTKSNPSSQIESSLKAGEGYKTKDVILTQN